MNCPMKLDKVHCQNCWFSKKTYPMGGELGEELVNFNACLYEEIINHHKEKINAN